MHRLSFCAVFCVLQWVGLAAGQTGSSLYLVDFEEHVEGTPIFDQYVAQGVTFAMGTTPGAYPIIATEGSPAVGFVGSGDDAPMASGSGGLTDPLAGEPGADENIVMIFDPPITSARLFVMDIDGSDVFTLRAYATGLEVDSETASSGDPGTGDGVSTEFFVAGAAIDQLVLETPSGGYAMDFLSFTRPCTGTECGPLIEIAQESAPGAGDFDGNVLGTMLAYPFTSTAFDFFAYDVPEGASWNGQALTPVAQRSHLLLAETTDGLSIFIVHDRAIPDDPDGGAARVEFTLFDDPDGAVRTVEDDPDEGYTGAAGASFFVADLTWSPCCTDGVAYSDLDGEWSAEVVFTSFSGMTEWVAYSSDGTEIPLAMQTNRRVRLRALALPDLAVEQITVDAPLVEGETATGSWTVRNLGDIAATGVWTDRAWLSADAVLDGSDYLISERVQSGPLAGGDAYVADISVDLPDDVFGPGFLFVETDTSDDVDEADGEGNNVSAPLAIQVLAGPLAASGGPYVMDASTASIQVSALGSADRDSLDPVTFQWDLGEDGIADDGERTTLAASVSRTEALSKGLDLFTQVPISVTVTDSDGLTATASTVISYVNTGPTAVPGGPYLVGPGAALELAGLVTDPDLLYAPSEGLSVEWDTRSLAEDAVIGNGFAFTESATIDHATLLTVLSGAVNNEIFLNVRDAFGAQSSMGVTVELVYPDLQVTDITSSCDTPSPGTIVDVTWTVTNNGSASATGTWTDEILLSDDAAVGGDTSLGTFVVDLPADLGPGENYTETLSVLMPETAVGAHRLVVSTDIGDDVAEFPEGGNSFLDDTDLSLPTDNTVTLFCWSQDGPPAAGNWAVSGDGQSVYQSINGEPTYFVSDFDLVGSQFTGTFSVETTGDDDYIGFVFGYKGLGGVAAGEGYYLFTWKQGNQSHTGYGEAGFKLAKITGTNPNLWDMETQAGQMEVLARLDGSNSLGWADNTEYNFFLSYQTSGAIRVIIRRASDGLELWNTGLIFDETPLGVGRVGFYNYSQSDVRYAGFTSAELEPPLAVAGGPYVFDAATSSVTLDATASFDPDGTGDFATDITALQWDVNTDGIADDAGRTLAMQPLSIAEATAAGLAIGNSLALGLEVTDADGLTSADVAGVISYQSTAPTADTGGPYAAVGPGESLHLLGVVDDADLAVGVGEALSVEWDVSPGGVIGDGFASTADVVIDYTTLVSLVTGSGNTFHLNVEDAGGQSATASVTVDLAFPDLTVTSVTSVSGAPIGTNVDVSWTVRNDGDAAATGTWEDRVYLSADAVLDGGDQLVASALRTDLGAGLEYTETMTTSIAGDPAGDVYFIVVTDAADVIEEVTGEGNNTASAVSPTNFFEDCNGNGQSDYDDINTTLISSDCNNNGVPDECELTLVYTEDFEGTVGSEWSNTTTLDNSVPGTFTRFSGRFGTTQAQSLMLPTVAGVDYTLTFDFYAIDSWDGNGSPGPDYFVITQDGGAEIFRETFGVVQTNQSYPFDPEFREHWGWNGSYEDSIFRQVTVSFTGAGSETLLTFFADGLQDFNDESWGIDNVRVLSEGSGDCNGNGQLDSCDIADGTSQDVNGNLVPDECEPHPDLVVENIDAPTSGETGAAVDVTWAVRNAGDAVDTGSWTDRVYISDDTTLDGGDTEVASYVRSGALGADAMYSRTESITLPAAAGDYWVIVSADEGDTLEEFAAEDNNTLADDASIGVVLAADLVVTDISAPSAASIGETITVMWTVTNNGDAAATAPWTDEVRLSGSPESVLGSAAATGDLAPGASQVMSADVTLPAGLDGDRFLIIETDRNDDVHETPNEGNNIATDDIPVGISAPDLVVTDITAPSSTVVGAAASISWTVTNSGSTSIDGTWSDRIYLSTDGAVGGDTLLATFGVTATLAPGESYTRTEDVTIDGVRGAHFIVVVSDTSDDVDEGSGEGNNGAADDASIAVQAPDLVVTDVTAPADAAVGSVVSLSWTVMNDGDAPVSGTWVDRLSLSDDAVIGGDVVFGNVAWTGTLNPGESYTQSSDIALPGGLDGLQYVVVRTDVQDAIDEADQEGNNTAIDDAAMGISAPDLVVTDITAPSGAVIGGDVSVSWTVTNNGLATVAGAWVDHVLQSGDASIGGDTLLGTFAWSGTLDPGESYTQTQTVTLASGASGDQRIVVMTDAGNTIDEASFEGNNSAIDDTVIDVDAPDFVVTSIDAPSTAVMGSNIIVSWTIRNDGDIAVTGSWADGVRLSGDASIGGDTDLAAFTYIGTLNPGETYTRTEAVSLPATAANQQWIVVVADINAEIDEGVGEGSNSFIDDAPIAIESPDLVVTDIAAPSSAIVGDVISVSWMVENSGDAPATGTWRDRVAQSGNDSIGGDTELANFEFTGTLNPGESYTMTENVTLASGGSGAQYIVVTTDVQNALAEGSFEGNNASIDDEPIDVAAPDLVVTSIDAPATAFVRDAIEVSWTVENAGTEPISGSWSDRVLLSPNGSIGSDQTIGSFGYSGSLAPGETYTQTHTIVLPPDAVNTRWVVIRTDINNDIVEGANEGNNAAIDDQGISIDGPDLVAVSLTAPSTATFSLPMTLDWTVRNDGGESTIGNWTDGLYLSTNATWDGSDRLLRGESAAVSPLEIGATYSLTTTLDLPLDDSTTDGDYYIILRTNAGQTLVETSSGNNTVASLPVSISRPALPDLEVTAVASPAPSAVGELIDITWTVTNTGSSVLAGESWGESVYVSDDESIGGDSIVAVRAFNHDLDPGESVVRNETIFAPNFFDSDWSLVVRVDPSGDVLELREDNNARIAPTPTTILRADLATTDVIVPPTGLADGTVDVIWSVENFGDAAASGVWVDRIYLSQDDILDPLEDLHIHTFTAILSVPAGDMYTQTEAVTLPGRIEGSWRLLVEANSNSGVQELDRLNNVNSAVNPIVISQPPRPNLVVSSIPPISAGLGGQPMSIDYIVTNSGDAEAAGFWTDRIIISTDNTLSPDDTLLETRLITTPVPAGDSYMETINAVYPDIPPNAPGDFTIFIETDRDDTLNEGLAGGEMDNLAMSDPFAITEPDRPNLVVTNITTPGPGLGGGPLDIAFTVTNIGPVPANGTWRERVYASRDPVLSGDDVQLGVVPATGPLANGASYTGNVSVAYPQEPGDYYLIVVADADAELLEGTGGGETDNVDADVSTFAVSGYTVTVDADVTAAPGGTPVRLTGEAVIEGTRDVAPNVPVSVRIGVQGSRRVINGVTDEFGLFDLTFRPLANEGGLYSVAAAAPYVPEDVIQDQFQLTTLLLSSSFSSPVVFPANPHIGVLQLRNPGDVTVTGVQSVVNNLPSGVTVDVDLANDFIPANGRTDVTYTINATEEVFVQQVVDLVFTDDQGATRTFQIFLSIVPNRPSIKVTPGSLTAEMIRGEQTIIEFDVENTGGAVAEDLELLLPPLPWLQPGTGDTLPDLDPGERASVILHLLPDETVPLGPFNGSLSVSGGGGTFGAAVPFTFIAASDQKGDLYIRVEDELTYWSTGEYAEEGGPQVPGAFVRVTDPVTGDVIAEGITESTRGASGDALVFPELAEGFYDVRVEAIDHSSFNGTVEVKSGQVNFVAPFITRNAVSYTWVVEEVDVDDTYIFTLETTFVTNVPQPVITVDPPLLDLAQITEDVTQIDVTVTNHGLIATSGPALINFGEHPLWRITPLTNDLGIIPAESEVVVPVIIERLGDEGRSDGPCSISAGVEWTLLCAGITTFQVPIPVLNISGKCVPEGGPIDVPNINTDPDGGFSSCGCGDGSPTAPYVNTPSYSLPDLCDCEEGEIFSVDIDPFMAPVEQGARLLLDFIPRIDKTDVDIDGQATLHRCCDEDGYPAGLDVTGSAGGSLKGEIKLVGESFELDGTGLLLGVPVTWSLSVEAQCVLQLAGSLSGGVDGPCEDDQHVTGAGMASATVCCSVGARGSISLIEPIDGFPLESAFNTSVGICLGAELAFTYDSENGGFDGTACFQGIWIEGELSANYADLNGDPHTIALIPNVPHPDVNPCSNRIYLVPPVGDCSDPCGGRDVSNEPYIGEGRVQLPASEADVNIEETLRTQFAQKAPRRIYTYRTQEGQLHEDAGLADRAVDEGVCAEVKLQLDQQVTITRTGFKATLEIENGNTIDPVENLAAFVTIEDEAGNNVNDLFFIADPDLVNLADVDGGGFINPQSFGRASWLIIPTRDAAPIDVTEYFVTGTLSYREAGTDVAIPLARAPITVRPDPLLVVKYFWQRDVFSDDPHTPEVEPSEPFSLGLTMSNIGYGEARNVQVASSQPRIIENERGLLIAFELIGTEVNGEAATPELTVDLGDIDPGMTSGARFLMTSTLQGQFTEYEASFEHTDELGGERTSLIDSVEIFELIHVVRTDEPDDDRLPDYMTNEIPDMNDLDLPDTVHMSDGTVADVTVITNAVVDAPATPFDLEVEVTATLVDGWCYFNLPDPSLGLLGDRAAPVQSILRSDGKEMIGEFNVWQTDRTFINPQDQPEREHKLHFFDAGVDGIGGTYTYTVVFAADALSPAATWQTVDTHGATVGDARLAIRADGTFTEPRDAGVTRLRVRFTEPVSAATFTPVAVQIDGLKAPDNSPVDLSGLKISTSLLSGNTVGVIQFSEPLLDIARYRVELVGVTDLAGNLLDESREVFFTALAGDVTGDRRVNNTDVNALDTLIGTDPIDPGNVQHVRADLNNDGRIDADDLTIAFARRGGDARFIPQPQPGGGLAIGGGVMPSLDYYGPSGLDITEGRRKDTNVRDSEGGRSYGAPSATVESGDDPIAAMWEGTSVSLRIPGIDADLVIERGNVAALVDGRGQVDASSGDVSPQWQHSTAPGDSVSEYRRHMQEIAATPGVLVASPALISRVGEFAMWPVFRVESAADAKPESVVAAIRGLGYEPVTGLDRQTYAIAPNRTGLDALDGALRIVATGSAASAMPLLVPVSSVSDIESPLVIEDLAAILPEHALAMLFSNSAMVGDLNGDGLVDALDLTDMVEALSGYTAPVAADLNGDGSVDLRDLSQLLDVYPAVR